MINIKKISGIIGGIKIYNQKIRRAIGILLIVLLITILSVITVNASIWGANPVGFSPGDGWNGNYDGWGGPGGVHWDDGLGSLVGGYGGFFGPGGAGYKGGFNIWGGGYGGYNGPEWSNYAANVRDCVNPYNSPWRAEVCRRSQSQRGNGMKG